MALMNGVQSGRGTVVSPDEQQHQHRLDGFIMLMGAMQSRQERTREKAIITHGQDW